MTLRARTIAALVGVCCSIVLSAQQAILPLKNDSVRFAVLGDTGTGDTAQREVAQQLVRFRQPFPFTFALMLGDNLYGSERPQDYTRKFEVPYKPLLDAKVEFHAALGNHDDPNQRFYKLFNLGGERYRTFKKENVRFFVLDSNYMDPAQLKWLEKELQASGSDWKIPYMHHPLYTSSSRGPVEELRTVLEPLFVKYGVDVVLSGHEHTYERIKPQQGVHYFVAGGSAKLKRGDLRKTALTEIGFDTDRTFILMEISGDELFFQAITRTGTTIDKGVIRRREVSSTIGPAKPGAPPLKPLPRRGEGVTGRPRP
jgi:predicted phosphodiesterase